MDLNSSSFVIAQWLFLKCLALNYFFAFGSLFLQVKGLYGSNGLSPIKELLAQIEKSQGKKLYFRVPTLFWLSDSDESIEYLAFLGMIGAALVMFGVVPAPLLLFLWIAYLSFCSVGSSFLSFQWDALLLEVGFIGIFFAIQTPPSPLMILLLWILVFRLMFSSGIVKLLSKCPEWGSLNAMDFHYETQPLPNRLAFYLHQQSKIFSKLSSLLVLVIEMAIPFLIFFTSEMRLAAFFLLAFLQIFILLTGNYAFFNTLSLTLLIPLLNNDHLSWLIEDPSITALPSNPILTVFLSLIAGILIFLNCLELIQTIFPNRFFITIFRALAPYYIVNPYGLFARMTTARNEIVIEGSDDGIEWKSYEFKWKPGNLSIAPQQVAPHQPRLDWQMWFAALGNYKQNPWFIRLLVRLMENSEDVLKLFKTNPFPKNPPKFTRSLLYSYHFTDLKTKRATGQWWTRNFLKIYSPSCSLQKKTSK